MQHFSRSNQRGCIFAVVLALAVAAGMVLDRLLFSEAGHFTAFDVIAGDSTPVVWISELADTHILQPVYPGTADSSEDVADAPLFSFDPNTADSATLTRLGFASWQARSIIRYRAKGGRFHRVDDMKRIYGMTPELFNRLSPYAYISEQFRYYEDMVEDVSHTYPSRRDTADRPYTSDKFTEPVTIDINTTDTATLKRIPGIGDIRAQRIVAYRDALGGFASPGQLHEIDGLPAGIEQWFVVETSVFRLVNINSDPVRTLARHPYISFAQARAIEQYRRTNGTIHNMRELQLLDEFNEYDFQRLEPYVAY